MKELSQAEAVRLFRTHETVSSCFEQDDLAFSAYQYQKGELLCSPHHPLQKMLFVVKGTVRIYALGKDGSLSPVHLMTAPGMLGDLEFCCGRVYSLYVEAQTPTTCLALDFEENRARLENDRRFLHALLRSFTQKFELFTAIHSESETVEEKILFYLSQMCPNQEFKGVDTVAFQLGCSRRQLQRGAQRFVCTAKNQKTRQGMVSVRDKVLKPMIKTA